MVQQKISPARRNCLRQIAGAAIGAATLSLSSRLTSAQSTCLVNPLRVGDHDFQYLDSLKYKNKPDLLDQGLSRVFIAYTWGIWGERKFDGVIEHSVPFDSIATYPKRFGLDVDPPQKFILDIEHWRTYGVSDAEKNRSLKNFRQTLTAFRQAMPRNTNITYYNLGPSPSYFFKVEGRYREKGYTSWRKDNDILAPIIECCDFLCPSLYFQRAMTLDLWKRRARDFIDESRRLLGDNRMIIPFLWPEYADHDVFGPIPPDIWREILAFVRSEADSVVLWRHAGAEAHSTWNEDAGWWQETKRALAR